jgi:hypothetical protein
MADIHFDGLDDAPVVAIAGGHGFSIVSLIIHVESVRILFGLIWNYTGNESTRITADAIKGGDSGLGFN